MQQYFVQPCSSYYIVGKIQPYVCVFFRSVIFLVRKENRKVFFVFFCFSFFVVWFWCTLFRRFCLLLFGSFLFFLCRMYDSISVFSFLCVEQEKKVKNFNKESLRQINFVFIMLMATIDKFYHLILLFNKNMIVKNLQIYIIS